MPDLSDRQTPSAFDIDTPQEETLAASAYLATIRADSLQAELRLTNQQLKLMRRSLSWRIMEPLRWIRALIFGRLPRGIPICEAWKQRLLSPSTERVSEAMEWGEASEN